MGAFEVYKDKAGEFRWRFKAANGNVIADSGEGYKAKSDCLRGVEILQEQAATAQVKDAD